LPDFMFNLSISVTGFTEIWSIAYTTILVRKLRLVHYTGM